MKKTITVAALAACWIAPTFWKKQHKGKRGIALTFDDGPHPVYTPQLLDLLKQYRIRATFFVVGAKAERYPAIIKRMAAEGHEIGIHHYEHISSWLLTPRALQQQINKTARIIEQISGQKPRYYRPPWGHSTLVSGQADYELVLWTRHFRDWRVQQAQQLAFHMEQAEKEGEVWLLHDCGKTIGAEENAPHYMLQGLAAFLSTTSATFLLLEQLYDG